MADFSYEITKCTDVDPLFGNLAMFDELLERVQALMRRYSQQKRRQAVFREMEKWYRRHVQSAIYIDEALLFSRCSIGGFCYAKVIAVTQRVRSVM